MIAIAEFAMPQLRRVEMCPPQASTAVAAVALNWTVIEVELLPA